MRRFFLLFCFFLAFPLLTGQGAFADFAWQTVDEGFEFAAARINGHPYQSSIKLKILRIDLEKFQVRVLDTRALGVDRLRIKAMARKFQALAAVNGGFFLPDYRPLGLLIMDGREVNPLRNADWGVFLVEGGQPRIVHTREFAPDQKISQALQVGPRLVVSGRQLQMKKQVARRSALGIDGKKRLILLNSEDSEVHAQDLARIFHLPESEGGLDCRDALALDGGPSAQMFADYRSLRVDIPGGWGVPNGIGVFKRDP